MPVRFLISALKPAVDTTEYERWVRERDYALVRSKPDCISFTLDRIRRPIGDAADADWYIERIKVASVKQHGHDLASSKGIALREELYCRFLDRARNIYFLTDPIE
jgi:hypothetical protein